MPPAWGSPAFGSRPQPAGQGQRQGQRPTVRRQQGWWTGSGTASSRTSKTLQFTVAPTAAMYSTRHSSVRAAQAEQHRLALRKPAALMACIPSGASSYPTQSCSRGRQAPS